MGSPMKQDTVLKLPINSEKTVPKKKPLCQKILAIKLPIDIDISIHREYNCGVAFFLIAITLLLFSLPFLFMYSHHKEMQVCQYELADLRLKVLEMNSVTQQISSTATAIATASHEAMSEALSVIEQCGCKPTNVKGTRHQKRDTETGRNGAIKAENEENDSVRDSASNDTMRGQIGPWYEDRQAVGDFGLGSCSLRDRGVKLIVNETGLYLIYAQVYYLTSESLNSYSINVHPGNKPTSIPVAFCSANASLNDQGASEVSCYTSIVRRLQAGDAISLQQQERQRRLIMREGHSFVGLVRLS